MWRHIAWGGAIGPVAFIGAWAIGGATANGAYSPVRDTISRLAAVGADTRTLMTAGLATFGLAVPVYAAALRRSVPGRAWITAATAGVATLGVAAAPLEHSPLIDQVHLVAAGTGYVALTAVPLLARRPLIDAGHRRLAGFGSVMAAIAVVALPLSLAIDQTGLLQRVGLTAGDLFLIVSVPTISGGRASIRPSARGRRDHR